MLVFGSCVLTGEVLPPPVKGKRAAREYMEEFADVSLSRPVCAALGSKVAVRRFSRGKWVLFGCGTVEDGDTAL